MLSPPPLSLYVHLPWCVRKCPYCDFNSHALNDNVDEPRYVDALLRDLDIEAPHVAHRRIETVFFGGGTPSLFSPEAIERILVGTKDRMAVAADAEITLEANPGTVDSERFRGFRTAGVNRLSIGVQSFDDVKLQSLGRIHGRDEALRAADVARSAGFANVNLDLMYALPEQTVEGALADVAQAIALAPTHLSIYQLTLEPNTLFHARPPVLPGDAIVDDMHEAILDLLMRHGYAPYEVSAYAKSDTQCRHNRNYWEFGDYIGIGAGAHGKITTNDSIVRTAKPRHPNAYIRTAGGENSRDARVVAVEDRPFEFFLNALRLYDGVDVQFFEERTGVALATVSRALETACAKGLLEESSTRLRATALGRRFLNDLTALFLPDKTGRA